MTKGSKPLYKSAFLGKMQEGLQFFSKYDILYRNLQRKRKQSEKI